MIESDCALDDYGCSVDNDLCDTGDDNGTLRTSEMDGTAYGVLMVAFGEWKTKNVPSHIVDERACGGVACFTILRPPHVTSTVQQVSTTVCMYHERPLSFACV